MFQFNAEFSAEYCDARDLDAARRFNPSLHSFGDWLSENVSKIPVS